MLTTIQPPDGGMLYTETNLQHFFPEPWNMVTSAFFLIPGLYWLIKFKGFSRQYAFLSVAVWLMLVGCVGAIALLLFLAAETGMRLLMPRTNIQLAISLNYAVMALMIVLPLVLLLIKTRGYQWHIVALALLSFVIALSFRVYDRFAVLSIGTHFLWHTFGAVATSLMFVYLYRLKQFNISAKI